MRVRHLSPVLASVGALLVIGTSVTAAAADPVVPGAETLVADSTGAGYLVQLGYTVGHTMSAQVTVPTVGCPANATESLSFRIDVGGDEITPSRAYRDATSSVVTSCVDGAPNYQVAVTTDVSVPAVTVATAPGHIVTLGVDLTRRATVVTATDVTTGTTISMSGIGMFNRYAMYGCHALTGTGGVGFPTFERVRVSRAVLDGAALGAASPTVRVFNRKRVKMVEPTVFGDNGRSFFLVFLRNSYTDAVADQPVTG